MGTPILPPLDFLTNINQYFANFGLIPYVCLHPFVKFSKEVSVHDYAVSLELQKDFFFYVKDPRHYVPWQMIAKELSFPSISYLNEVMMAGDNSLAKSRRFDYEQLKKDATRLYSFLDGQNINQLSEGSFPAEYQVAFLKSLLSVGYDKALGADEFDPEGEEFDLAEKISFLEGNKQYLEYRSLCTKDVKIVFTVHWDCFFTVLAATEELLPRVLASHSFEGFYPVEEMTYLL